MKVASNTSRIGRLTALAAHHYGGKANIPQHVAVAIQSHRTTRLSPTFLKDALPKLDSKQDGLNQAQSLVKMRFKNEGDAYRALYLAMNPDHDRLRPLYHSSTNALSVAVHKYMALKNQGEETKKIWRWEPWPAEKIDTIINLLVDMARITQTPQTAKTHYGKDPSHPVLMAYPNDTAKKVKARYQRQLSVYDAKKRKVIQHTREIEIQKSMKQLEDAQQLVSSSDWNPSTPKKVDALTPFVILALFSDSVSKLPEDINDRIVFNTVDTAIINEAKQRIETAKDCIQETNRLVHIIELALANGYTIDAELLRIANAIAWPTSSGTSAAALQSRVQQLWNRGEELLSNIPNYDLKNDNYAFSNNVTAVARITLDRRIGYKP